jgi:hypothetical protein
MGLLLTAREHGRTIVAVSAALALALTFLVYRPDRDLPFDFVDFSEFLPLLQRGESFIGRMRELLGYYAGQGRANVVGYAAIALKWGLWGDSAPAWQWTRFVVMWLVVVLTYLLLRRVGASRLASMTGASVFLFSLPAVDGWLRLTMAEPAGTILLLMACFIAVRGRPSDGARVGLPFALVCATLVLLKEMLAATLVLPLALVVTRAYRAEGGARRSRLISLAVSGGVTVALAGIPVALVALSAPGDAYTAEFGARLRPIGDVFAAWTLGLAPFGLGTSFPPSLAGIALLALVGLLVAGWAIELRRRDAAESGSRMLLAIGLVFPLLGSAIYLPWPSYNRFYAIPFMLGGALLAGIALSALEYRSPRASVATYCVWLLFLLFGAADAAGQSARAAVRQRITREVVARVAGMKEQVDTIFLATDQRPPTVWQGIGPTLQRYGEAMGHSMPPFINMSCDESRRRAATGDAAVVVFSTLCPGITMRDPIISRYRRLALPSTRLRAESIRVDFVRPGPSVERTAPNVR